MSYSFKGRVRYSEIGEDGCLTLPGIQNYYQDCCTFQSENIGQGMERWRNAREPGYCHPGRLW